MSQSFSELAIFYLWALIKTKLVACPQSISEDGSGWSTLENEWVLVVKRMSGESGCGPMCVKYSPAQHISFLSTVISWPSFFWSPLTWLTSVSYLDLTCCCQSIFSYTDRISGGGCLHCPSLLYEQRRRQSPPPFEAPFGLPFCSG